MIGHDSNYPFSNLFDSELTSGVRSITATPTDKFSLTVKFPLKVSIGAVFIHSDESKMNSGGFKVLVYDEILKAGEDAKDLELKLISEFQKIGKFLEECNERSSC